MSGSAPVGNQLTFNSITLANTSDDFGRSLTSGDYNRDGFADLPAGAQNGAAPSGVRGGTGAVRYGAVNGIPDPVGQDYWHQDVSEENDFFGFFLPRLGNGIVLAVSWELL